MTANGQSILRASGICKSYGGIRALQDVDFELLPGEVHALVGENGAGKSTLIKILSGVVRPDAGRIEWEGRPVEIPDPSAAQRLGVATVYQDPLLFPDLSVLDNMFAGREVLTRAGNVDRRKEREMAVRAFGDLEVGLSEALLERPMRSLSLAHKQLVLIAKALIHQARVLIFDEPTAILSDQEADRLFAVIRGLRRRQVGIVYISHRLEEIFQLADRVTVMRDGRVRGTFPVGQVTEESIIELMAGRELHRQAPDGAPAGGPVVLRVRGLSRPGLFEGIAFEARAGEVLGFFGLVGSGRSEVMQEIVGVSALAVAGRIEVDGRPVRPRSPAEAMRLGIAYVPEDRKGQGLFGVLPVRYNLSVAILKSLARFGLFVDGSKEAEASRRFVADLNIRIPGLSAPVLSLSGGNQQKVVLARWLAVRPRVLILDEPTRGIDVASKEEIHQRIRALARGGVAVVVISSELPEILKLADRIVVMHEGRISGTFDRREASEELVLAAAMGRAAAVQPA
ncbi:MAG: sugar ABC transporter ATP-binding protein [Limnochordaceae bacterium]|nr:sugar ABC transporter ATP-binding protein [Limnochordaceae bacterium]